MGKKRKRRNKKTDDVVVVARLADILVIALTDSIVINVGSTFAAEITVLA